MLCVITLCVKHILSNVVRRCDPAPSAAWLRGFTHAYLRFCVSKAHGDGGISRWSSVVSLNDTLLCETVVQHALGMGTKLKVLNMVAIVADYIYKSGVRPRGASNGFFPRETISDSGRSAPVPAQGHRSVWGTFLGVRDTRSARTRMPPCASGQNRLLGRWYPTSCTPTCRAG